MDELAEVEDAHAGARRRFERQLGALPSAKSITIDTDLILLFAWDLALLQLLRSPYLEEIQLTIKDVTRSDLHRVGLRQGDLDDGNALLCRVLGSISSLAIVRSKPPTSARFTAFIMTACRQVRELDLIYSFSRDRWPVLAPTENDVHTRRLATNLHFHSEDMSQEAFARLAASLHSHPALDRLVLYFIEQKALRILSTVFASMPRLTELNICGGDRNPLMIGSPDDALLFDEIFQCPALEQLQLNGMTIVSGDAALVFCRALRTSHIRKLVLRKEFHFPPNKVADLAVSLTYSGITEFDLWTSVNRAFKGAFLLALCTGDTARITQFSFAGNVRLQMTAGRPCAQRVGLDPDPEWIRLVEQCLGLNFDRRSANFSVADEARSKRSRQLLLAEALAWCDLSILYELMHRNECNLVSIIPRSLHEYEKVLVRRYLKRKAELRSTYWPCAGFVTSFWLGSLALQEDRSPIRSRSVASLNPHAIKSILASWKEVILVSAKKFVWTPCAEFVRSLCTTRRQEYFM